MREILRAIPYQQQLIRLAGLLRVRGPLRRLYCHWLGPRGGILRVEVGGRTVQFYVHGPAQLQALEDLGGEGHLVELLSREVEPGDCVYDIGAGVGLYTLFLAQAVGENGQVAAFEPQEHTYERLQDNLKLNGLRNVRAFQAALGETNGEMKLYLGEVAGAARLSQQCTSEKQFELVPVVEGDRLRQVEKLRTPRVVKIDVEGYEYAVIRGLDRTLAEPTCEIVCCEVHPHLLPVEVKPEEILNLLKSLGFHRIDTYARTQDFHVVARKG